MPTPLEEFRAGKDRFFGHDVDSPLTPRQRRQFQGLAYFPEDPTLRLAVHVEELPEKEAIQMGTSTGGVATYLRWGRFRFQAGGQPVELTIYQDAERGDLFLPFRDATCGDESYEVGRYLEPEPLEEGTVLVDFNYAYNPYCAYNDRWTCPIPPPENRLRVAVRAGEKAFPQRAHERDAEGP